MHLNTRKSFIVKMWKKLNDNIINDLKIHPTGRNDVHEMYISQNS